MIALILYLAAIVGANVAITLWGVVPVGFGLYAPAGVLFVGLALTLRDLVQDRYGRRGVVAAIVAGALLSALLSPALALASGTAFLLSEAVDMAVYTPLRARGHRLWAVALSNGVSAPIDSIAFLWLAFGNLTYLPGQVVGKYEMTLLTVLVLAGWQVARRRSTLRAA